MASYRVIVTRDTTESTVVEVEAETPEYAELYAIDASRQPGVVWEQDSTPSMSKEHYTNGAELLA